MANYEIPNNPEYDEEIRKLEQSDPGNANIFNTIFGRIIRNVAHLKRHAVTRENLGIPEGETVGVGSQVPVFPAPPANRENISDGDNMGTILAKIKKWFADLKNVAFTGSYTDLSNKPTMLKNPKLIKINGKSYDGSAEVDAGTLGIGYGGTGATAAAAARTNLGLGAASTQGVANNLTTTAAGYALDARQGKNLKDSVDTLNSSLNAMGQIITGTIKTVVSFTDDKWSVLATITLPAGNWIVFARCVATGSDEANGTTVDYKLEVNQNSYCTLIVPKNFQWERQTLIGAEIGGNRTFNVIAVPFGEVAADQIKCEMLYAFRIK